MKTFLRILASILIILAVAALALVITGHSYLFKGVWATYLHGEKTTSIGDWRFFDLREVPATAPAEWPVRKNHNTQNLSNTLRHTLENTETVAFLVVKNDSIAYEEYWDGYSDTSHSNSFSMAKSFTTLLAQKAIQDGYIQSWDDPVIDYLPNLQGPYRKELKLKHLSQMTAGLQWDESYTSPFSILAEAYYSSDVPEVMIEEVPVVVKPGSQYEYQSGASQLLGMAIVKATGKSISEYFAETLWKGMHAREDAWWHLDDEGGMEITYCCLNSNARDFARFGKLLLHHGRWEGEQLIDSSFVAKATKGVAAPHYGWSFWVYTDFVNEVYFMRGMHGQYVIVIPEKDLVICRLGKTYVKDETVYPVDFRVIVEETAKYFGN